MRAGVFCGTHSPVTPPSRCRDPHNPRKLPLIVHIVSATVPPSTAGVHPHTPACTSAAVEANWPVSAIHRSPAEPLVHASPGSAGTASSHPHGALPTGTHTPLQQTSPLQSLSVMHAVHPKPPSPIGTQYPVGPSHAVLAPHTSPRFTHPLAPG